MEKHYIIIREYCDQFEISPTFIDSLSDEGIITVLIENEKRCFTPDELKIVDRMRRLHFDLDINVEGLAVIHRLLGKIETLQLEVRKLRLPR